MTDEEKKKAEEEAAAKKAEDERIRKENEELKKELEDKKSASDPVHQRPQENEPTEEQWNALEERYGMDRKQIRAQWEMTAAQTAPLRKENEELRAQVAGDKHVKSAKAKAKADDPQFPKYEKYVDEYLDRLPAAVKADPKKLAEEMDRAVRYGRGSIPVAERSDRREPEPGGRREEEDPDNRNQAKNDEYFGVHKNGKQGDFEVQKRVPDDYRKENTHPHFEGGVQIDERSEWKRMKGAT